jgi:pimeloyl-ACP methyl ester carboxylesterase
MNLKNIVFFSLLTLSSIFSVIGKNKVVTIFSHGIADTWKQVHGYVKSYQKHNTTHRNDRYLIHTPFISFNYPDATNKFYRVNYNETSFGQENEIGRLYKAYNTALSHYKKDSCDIILCGLSRGASNVLIFAGLYNLRQVKAIVVESPYYSMSEVIKSLMTKKNMGWLDISYGETIAEYIFKKYSRHGLSPAKCLESIPKDMPILIICSQEDSLVPASTSINVYKKLLESGHTNAYLFVTEHGKHAAILQGPDGEKYQWVVNAFYKKYNLPHCAASAAHGKSLLTLCQPTI